MEEKAFYKLLVERYVAKRLTDEELEVFVALARDGKLDEELARAMTEVLEPAEENVPKPGIYKLWPKIAVTAAAVAAVVFGVWFFNANRHLEGSVATRDLLVKDIAPGKNGATITLANGQVIELSGAKKGVIVGEELRYDDHTPVISTGPSSRGTERSLDDAKPRDLSQGRDDDKVFEMTASTTKGQTYEFTLPDGTHVWLNADSRISFPSQFNGKERKILLSGEAYFAVRHNDKQPFKVESRGQVVEDIGTEFNINAYADETSVKTTLVEGSAKVNDVLLKPNQQSLLTLNTIKVIPADVEQVTAWKAGDFIFKEERIENIMQQVSRWYNVEVSYADESIKDVKLGGFVSRSKNISAVLKMMTLTKRVNFKVEGKKVTVLP